MGLINGKTKVEEKKVCQRSIYLGSVIYCAFIVCILHREGKRDGSYHPSSGYRYKTREQFTTLLREVVESASGRYLLDAYHPDVFLDRYFKVRVI